MDFTKAIKEISVSEREYKDFVKNNINDTHEIDEYLFRIKEDIEFKLFNEKSKLKIEIDELLKNNFVYIKNKDVYYCKDLNGLFPNFETFKFGKNNTYYGFNLNNSKLKFSGYNGSSINEKEANYIHDIWKRYDTAPKKVVINNLYMPITYYNIKTKEWNYITSEGEKKKFNIYQSGDSSLIPIYRLENHKKVIFTLIKENLIPKGLSM